MIPPRKICVVTGTRADYGLLYWILKDIQNSPELELQLVVTGMHLSPDFGNTYKEIEKDGFVIDRKVDLQLDSDSAEGVVSSMGIGMPGFANAFNELQPDILLVLGDRFEIFAATTTAMVQQIPVAHIHGGESSEGVFDEQIRHSITKMSHIHFTASEVYKNRVLQLGEQPDCVFNFGAVGVDNIHRYELLTKEHLEKEINFKFASKNILVAFHPVTLEENTFQEQFSALLSVLDNLQDTNIAFTKSNADPGGQLINTMIDEFIQNHKDTSIAFHSMGQLNYLSALQFVDAVVGNSSSGIIEAPSFKIGTINIGDRQRGRIRAKSVIDCNPTIESIGEAIDRLYSTSFQAELENVQSPFGKGGTASRIVDKISTFPLSGILKKSFNDLPTFG
jgi:GDP/UDP-N,N'-diacetylbacillosamine 2-epimerase (hydrolysing)